MIFDSIFNRLSKGYSPGKPNILRLSKNDASNELVKNGEDMANAKRYDEALTFFEKALSINPNNDMLLVQIKNPKYISCSIIVP